MPIYEENPWRKQYFQEVACPSDVHIPTDDPDAYRRNPDYRWVYNKLALAESQGLGCAPHGVEPTSYPVFTKPIINLRSMGQGSRTLASREEYLQQQTPGHFWMTLLRGAHVSSDLAVIRGETAWIRHPVGLPLGGGQSPGERPRLGYSVVLFGPHGRRYRHPARGLIDELRQMPGIASLQITFHEDRPAARHS